MNCSIVLDKRWTVKDDANFKVQNIVLDNGTEQTAVVMKIATYAEAYRRYLATYIHGILCISRPHSSCFIPIQGSFRETVRAIERLCRPCILNDRQQLKERT